MTQLIISAVRTGVQALIGFLLSVPAVEAIGVDLAALEAVLISVGVGLVTLILRWLETRFPWLVGILSLGTSSSGPAYEPKHLA